MCFEKQLVSSLSVVTWINTAALKRSAQLRQMIRTLQKTAITNIYKTFLSFYVETCFNCLPSMHQDIKPLIELSLVLQMKTVWPGGRVSWTQSPFRWTSCPTAFQTRWVPTGSPPAGRGDRVSGCWLIRWLVVMFWGKSLIRLCLCVCSRSWLRRSRSRPWRKPSVRTKRSFWDFYWPRCSADSRERLLEYKWYGKIWLFVSVVLQAGASLTRSQVVGSNVPWIRKGLLTVVTRLSQS